MNSTNSLRIQVPKNETRKNKKIVQRTPTTFVQPRLAIPNKVNLKLKNNPFYSVQKEYEQPAREATISTTTTPRSRTSTLSLPNYLNSSPSSRRSSLSILTPVITPPRTPIASIATVTNFSNFTGLNSSRNLNTPPKYNPNFKVPRNNYKTRNQRVQNTQKIKKNMNVIQSYGPKAKEIYKKYNEPNASNKQKLNLLKQETQIQRNSNKNTANKIPNWNKPTKRKWYNPVSWFNKGKTRKNRKV